MKLIKYVNVELSDLYKSDLVEQFSNLNINKPEIKRDFLTQNLKIGDCVLLLTPTKIFNNEHRVYVGEYFWVEIVKIKENYFLGRVTDYTASGKIQYGEIVKFFPFNVAKIKIKNREEKTEKQMISSLSNLHIN